jgi:hypothetical protein
MYALSSAEGLQLDSCTYVVDMQDVGLTDRLTTSREHLMRRVRETDNGELKFTCEGRSWETEGTGSVR